MRRPPGILPYAALAIVIVVASAATVVAAVYGPFGETPAAASPTPSAVPTRPPRALTDLSPAGRIAYWREDPAGAYQLWVANVDNARRRVIATTDVPGNVTETRWSLGGGEVGYVENGVRLVVARIDGVTSAYTLAPELRAEGWRITDHRFSPSGERVVATAQRSSGSQTDVFLAAPDGGFTRLTDTEDVLAGDWISEDELLVNTSGGVLARLRIAGTDRLRPITSIPAATPILGKDGRVYFLTGRVSSFAASDAIRVYAGNPAVWSITADGDDPRIERTFVDPDSQRLDGFWPGGSFLVHHGTNPAQAIGPLAAVIPSNAGVVERLRVSADERYAIGVAGTNVVRFDVSPTGEFGGAVVLLGAVTQADVWFPTAPAAMAHAPSAHTLPDGKYVFALGGSWWLMRSDGALTLLRAGNRNAHTLRRFALAPPSWSPAGDRLLTVESLGSGASAFQLVPTVIGTDGTARRYTGYTSVTQTVSWSPDGQRIAFVSLPGAAQDPTVLANPLLVHVLDTTSGSTVTSFPGRGAYWTKTGIVFLTNGTLGPGGRAREEQTIDLWRDGETRTIARIADLRSDPRAQPPADPAGVTSVGTLSASPDGAFVTAHLSFLPTGRPVFAIVRARDGIATVIVSADAVTDEAWSPSSHAVGYTRALASGSTQAVVRDAETGQAVLQGSGRFAGWSADGAWVFVAREDGLYARRVDQSGELARVSAFGVPMSVAAP